jgi:hypothetical protein
MSREDQLKVYKGLAEKKCKGYVIDGKAYGTDDNFCGDKGLKWAETKTDEYFKIMKNENPYISEKEGPLPGADYMKNLAVDSFNSLHRREPTRGNTNRQQAPVECVLPDRKRKETDTSICYPVTLDTDVMDDFNKIENKVTEYNEEFLYLKKKPTEENKKLSTTDKKNKDVAKQVDNIINNIRRQYEKARITALEYKNYIVKKNDAFLDRKDEFINATNKLNLKKSDNLASQLLKIDIYDRNIEDNIYIIYYLLSYGVMGFFIYKLLK